MNNSRLIIDTVPLTLEPEVLNIQHVRAREEQITRIILALRKVQGSKEWSSLKTELFDGLTERLSKELLTESRKESPDTLKLSKLAGQLKWAERYSDLTKIEKELMDELSSLKLKLHGKTEETG